MTQEIRVEKGLGCRQLGAVLWKNALIKRRNKCQFCCELVTPMLLMLILVIGWSFSLSQITEVEAKIYTREEFKVLQPFLDLAEDSIYPAGQQPEGRTCYDVPGTGGLVVVCPDDLAPDDAIDLLERIYHYKGPVTVPSLEEYVTLHYLLEDALTNLTSSYEDAVDRIEKVTNGHLDNLIYMGTLAFSPQTNEVFELIEYLNNTYPQFNKVFDKVYPDEDSAVNKALDTHSYYDRTWAVINFNQISVMDGKVDYTIRMNYSAIPSTKELASYFQLGFDSHYKRYFYSGFLSLQNAIDGFVLNQTAEILDSSLPTPLQSLHPFEKEAIYSKPDLELRVHDVQDYYDYFDTLDNVRQSPSTEDWSSFTAVPFPTGALKKNPFYQAVGPLVGLVMCMSMLYPVSRLIKGIVEEKETKIKETMRMMGLKSWVFAVSWFITAFVIFTIIALGIALILSASVLQRTSFSLLFVFFFFFVISQITFSFLVSAFFSKAKLAGIVGPLLLFVCVMPRYAFFSQGNDYGVGAKTLTSLLFAPTAFAFGADLLMQYEGANMGMSWSTVGDDSFSMSRSLSIMLIDFFLYGILAWYCEQVLPNQYGTKKKWYFCCKPCLYPCRSSSSSDGSDSSNRYSTLDGDAGDSRLPSARSEDGKSRGGSSRMSDVELRVSTYDRLQGHHIETVPEGMEQDATMKLQRLRKVFVEGNGKNKKVTVAVKSLDLTMYKGQITALLGHNGAGKTTTISMLTGLIPPTKGDAIINGYSIRSEMDEIRKSLGVCPQHDVLWDNLSVREHLQLYATLKGIPSEMIHDTVTDIINDVGLEKKSNTWSKGLSGGMKRKLSVANALIGGSSIIFLDEPTSGMDPYSRRATWELLRRNTVGRTIILTTHFMDEADLLGDRIAIMAEGRLQCVGSSLFLKARYGIGYTLSLVKENEHCDVKSVDELITRHCPTAENLSRAGGEMSFRLPLDAVDYFADLFAELEQKRKELYIGSYGISMTTLEEVFMRIAHLHEEEKDAGLLSGDEDDDDKDDGKTQSIQDRKSRDGDDTQEGHPTAINSDEGPLQIPLLNTTADHFRNSASNVSSSSPRVSKTNRSSSSSSSLDDSEFKLRVTGPRDSGFNRQFVELFRKRFICAFRDLKGRFFEVVLPVLVVSLVLLILKLNINPAGPSIQLDSGLYGSASSARSKSSGIQGGASSVPVSSYSFANQEPETSLYLRQDEYFSIQNLNYTDSTEMSYYLLDSLNMHQGVDRYGAYILNDTYSTLIHYNFSDFLPGLDTSGTNISVPAKLSVMHNTTYYHSIPIMISEITEARYSANLNTGIESSKEANARIAVGTRASLKISSHPLPLTQREELRIRTFLTLFAALFILIPFCYLPATFVIFIVKERATKAKHLQIVSGVKPLAYWASTYAWDVINYIFVIACVMVVFLLYKNDEFVGTSNHAWGVWFLLLLYGVASLPLSYLYSFIFTNHTSAQVGIAGIHFVCGFVLVVASFILDSVDSTKDTNATLKHLYRVFPTFNLGEGLIQVATLSFRTEFLDEHKSAFDMDVLGQELIYLMCEAVGFSILVMIIEFGALKALTRSCRRVNLPLVTPPGFVEDDDVTRERERVENGEYEGENVVLNKLRKVYPATGGKGPHPAVQDLSLHIPADECFGFLGINGAGKTSTLKMMTGDEDVTSGTGTLGGYDIVSQKAEVRQELGYCPQFDPLLELMTAREQLTMYARLRGIREELVAETVQYLIDKLSLTEYADKTSGSYSGGNKRKLSLGMSVVGDPVIVLLDEPSTGMDPVSKRFMWGVISSLCKNRSVILTTHSMEECEALCSRLAIMVSGRLRCIGTIQHLKSKFGKGYHMEISTSPDNVKRVQNFVADVFEGASLEEFHGGRLKYKLPIQNLSLSSIFGTIQQAKADLGIVDYSISQTTLEQVFILMAKQQHLDELEDGEELEDSRFSISEYDDLDQKEQI